MKKKKVRTKKASMPRIIRLTPEQHTALTAALIASNLDQDFKHGSSRLKPTLIF